MCTVLHIAVIWSNYMEMFAILLKCVCLNITSPEELVHINGRDSLALFNSYIACTQTSCYNAYFLIDVLSGYF